MLCFVISLLVVSLSSPSAGNPSRTTDTNSLRHKCVSCNSMTSFCNTAVSPPTCDCKKGFIRSKNNIDCLDINECELLQDNCLSYGSKCTNIYGSFVCSCEKGFVSETQGICKDINECLNPLVCDKKTQECLNTRGSYHCRCRKGFAEVKQGTKCIDIDECENEPCQKEMEVCLNVKGSYRCRCKQFLLSLNGSCLFKESGNVKVSLKKKLMAVTTVIVVVLFIAFISFYQILNIKTDFSALMEKNLWT